MRPPDEVKKLQMVKVLIDEIIRVKTEVSREEEKETASSYENMLEIIITLMQGE